MFIAQVDGFFNEDQLNNPNIVKTNVSLFVFTCSKDIQNKKKKKDFLYINH